MRIRFHVLASGSSGNACVIEAGGACVLVDFGLSARTLTRRLEARGLSWQRLSAALLSHTHGDHWQAGVVTQLARHRIPLYCHADHLPCLGLARSACVELSSTGLLRHYEPGRRLGLHAECECVPVAISHDADSTCGFRFEGPASLFGEREWAIGYATDLGCWSPRLAQEFADVDLLGLEFNHDVRMQLASRRSALLIRRVLGDAGHLSNEQAASLLAEVIACSQPGRLKSVVQLHLSRDCNRPELARAAAQKTLDRLGVAAAIHTVPRGRVGPTIRLDEARSSRSRRAGVSGSAAQPLLPFAADF